MNESEIPAPLVLPPDPKLPKIEQDTIPMPDAAQQVISALAPKLDAILTEIGLIKLHVGHLDTEIVELRASRITSDAKINAIDTGVSAIFRMVGELDAKAEHIKTAQRDTANKTLEHAQLLQTIKAEVTSKHEHVVARVVSLEDRREEQRAQDEAAIAK